MLTSNVSILFYIMMSITHSIIKISSSSKQFQFILSDYIIIKYTYTWKQHIMILNLALGAILWWLFIYLALGGEIDFPREWVWHIRRVHMAIMYELLLCITLSMDFGILKKSCKILSCTSTTFITLEKVCIRIEWLNDLWLTFDN